MWRPDGFVPVSDCFFAFALLARLEERGVPIPGDGSGSKFRAPEKEGRFFGLGGTPAEMAAFHAKTAQIARHDEAPVQALLDFTRENVAAIRMARPGGDLLVVEPKMFESVDREGRLIPACFDPLTGQVGWRRERPMSGVDMELLREGIKQISDFETLLVPVQNLIGMQGIFIFVEESLWLEISAAPQKPEDEPKLDEYIDKYLLKFSLNDVSAWVDFLIATKGRTQIAEKAPGTTRDRIIESVKRKRSRVGPGNHQQFAEQVWAAMIAEVPEAGRPGRPRNS